MGHIDISIIVPVFNCEKYLDVLFPCLLQQDDISFEIIAVNDGSTDNSLAILKNFAQQDSRIIIVDQPNQGLSAARNAGLKQAQGEYIGFVDGDDWVSPNMFSHWVAEAKNQNVDVLIGNAFTFKDDPIQESGKTLLTKQPWGDLISGEEWIVHCVNNKEWPHFAWLQLIRREIILEGELSFIRGMLHEDILWTTLLALSVKRIGFCEKPIYGYRRGNVNSITRSVSFEKIHSRTNSYIDIISCLTRIAKTRKDDRDLYIALLSHAQSESRNLFGLIRKGVSQSPLRRELSRRVIKENICHLLYMHPKSLSELWYALRFTMTMYIYSRL
ncbi:glycosyltransferase [Dickeya sp. NCPPB 3274]|uniref:glycosyltransferase n=1 Tax=Dickeya sp. NCPPB 3274 TaxID=568766 RepID=UPI00039EC5EA|nr:glycosyltransferase [Dickeya sp. NCPPB 3274]